jgi:hypothetical protein
MWTKVRMKHMKAAEHVLKYLSGSYADGLYFGENLEQRNGLWGWVDADFAILPLIWIHVVCTRETF